MRTEHDLHDAFTLLARAADARGVRSSTQHPLSGDHIVMLDAASPGSRESTHRRWIMPVNLAASVALVAATTATVVALSTRDDGSNRVDNGRHSVSAASPNVAASTAGRTDSGGSGPTSNPVPLHAMPFHDLVFTVTAAGLVPSGTLLGGEEQIVNLVGTSGSYIVRVYTDQAGADYVTDGATPVRVNGHRGYYARLTSDSGGSQRGIAWEYAPGAWASVARTDATITSTQGIELAATVHVGTTAQARTPVSIAPIAGLRTDLWLTGYGNDPTGQGQDGYVGWNVLHNLDFHGALVTVAADDDPGSIDTSGERTIVNGHGARVTFSGATHRVSINWNGHAVDIQENVDGSTGHYHLTKAQLLEVARSVTLVDHPADPTTWFDAKDALPAP